MVRNPLSVLLEVCEGKKCILYDQDDEGMLYDPPNWSQGNSLVPLASLSLDGGRTARS